ncbi:MAG TPA: PKD domain-containing protein, partial [Chryseolinea sp.]|nr:PKD domain-containing protein [Chryseolinea sp.]
MPNLPTINVIYASDALEQLEALKNILEKFKAERRISDYTLIADVDQFVSSQYKVKANDTLITLLTLKLARLDEIRSISKQLKVSWPEIKVFEIIVDQLPYDNKFVTFPPDLAPIRGRNDMVSVWSDIEKTLRSMLPAIQPPPPPPPPDGWKTILKIGIPLIIIIALIFWWQFRNNGNPPEQTPLAQFSSDKTTCEAPCTIVFANSSQNAASYRWDFGNGDSSENVNPTYTFKNGGNFIVKLTALGKDQQHEVTHEIVVGSAATPDATPVANFTPSKTNCLIPCTINFTNKSENSTSYRWDFGDGATSTDASPTHDYMDAGQY